jgi:hypothetical protein
MGDSCGGGGTPGQCGHQSVDLSAQQTGIRNQGQRDTCTAFAATAAVEAAYKRSYGLNLDLSEQYLHHFQKSLWLNFTTTLPQPEIQPETNGGGNVPFQFAALTRFGLPLETSLPYIGSPTWQNPAGWTSLNGTLFNTDQRALDDFLLSPTLVTYNTPAPITATVLPQGALDGARYRPLSTKTASASNLTSLAWYKSELQLGREIAFDVNLTRDDPSPSNGIWDPGSTAWGGHAMLIVGFDDSKQAFLVKNSWGAAAFDWFSYTWATGGRITSAMTIIDVADPFTAFGTNENPQLALGRWNLDFDGWRGTLDLYRLPDNGASVDHRYGTYFGPDGVARRVNGTFSGNRVDLYIDWNSPNMAPSVLGQGMHFEGRIYEHDHTAMAGSMYDTSGNAWEYTATKGRWVDGVRNTPVALDHSAYSGRWQLDVDGILGILAISADAAGDISGSFTDSSGVTSGVFGWAMPDRRLFRILIDNGPQYTDLDGQLNGRTMTVMAGTGARAHHWSQFCLKAFASS